MATFEQLAAVSAIPIVDLQNITVPRTGLLVAVPSCCARNFDSSDKCRKHYEALRDSNGNNEITQCPFGLSSYKFHLGNHQLALTSFVPYPRMGGKRERDIAKQYPGAKIVRAATMDCASSLSVFDSRLASIEKEVIDQQSFALHEIRKLNREVKQNAERLCKRSNPENPESADSLLVSIWKASELMSGQFAAIELLANEQLADLPLTSESEIYRVFDKCARIYNRGEAKWRIFIRAPGDFNARIHVCDKTFPIVPTVLIENALKYSLPNSEVTIELDLSADRQSCIASVTNTVNPALIPEKSRIDTAVFEKGKRIAVAGEGSGNGLYLAKLITLQHKGHIYVSERRDDGSGYRLVTFHVAFPRITE